MSVVWYSVRLITNMHGIKTPTKHISLGFPAKWLIFIAFMLWPSFWNGSYFQPGQYFDTCLNIFVQRNLSSLQIAKDVRYTWVFLRDYKYECWTELQTSSLWGLNKYNQFKFNNEVKANKPFNQFKTNIDKIRFYDARKTDEDITFKFQDAVEHEQLELDLNITQEVTHVVNTLSNLEDRNDPFAYTAPAVSSKAGLELLKEQELEVNLSVQDNQPIIIDTGASLAITGNKMDFLTNTYYEVNALKLGGMAAGARIEGIGNVAWTFPCDNGDSLAILTKCYYVPSANT